MDQHKEENTLSIDNSIKKGSYIEARDGDHWYIAKVIDYKKEARKILIHFKGWNNKYDEWLSLDNERIRPISNKIKNGFFQITKELELGDRVLARWSVKFQYTPGKITSINPDGKIGYCEVSFVDKTKKILRSNSVKPLDSRFDLKGYLESLNFSLPTEPTIEESIQKSADNDLLNKEQVKENNENKTKEDSEINMKEESGNAKEDRIRFGTVYLPFTDIEMITEFKELCQKWEDRNIVITNISFEDHDNDLTPTTLEIDHADKSAPTTSDVKHRVKRKYRKKILPNKAKMSSFPINLPDSHNLNLPMERNSVIQDIIKDLSIYDTNNGNDNIMNLEGIYSVRAYDSDIDVAVPGLHFYDHNYLIGKAAQSEYLPASSSSCFRIKPSTAAMQSQQIPQQSLKNTDTSMPKKYNKQNRCYRKRYSTHMADYFDTSKATIKYSCDQKGCTKEFRNSYLLESHLLHFHGIKTTKSDATLLDRLDHINYKTGNRVDNLKMETDDDRISYLSSSASSYEGEQELDPEIKLLRRMRERRKHKFSRLLSVNSTVASYSAHGITNTVSYDKQCMSPRQSIPKDTESSNMEIIKDKKEDTIFKQSTNNDPDFAKPKKRIAANRIKKAKLTFNTSAFFMPKKKDSSNSQKIIHETSIDLDDQEKGTDTIIEPEAGIQSSPILSPAFQMQEIHEENDPKTIGSPIALPRIIDEEFESIFNVSQGKESIKMMPEKIVTNDIVEKKVTKLRGKKNYRDKGIEFSPKKKTIQLETAEPSISINVEDMEIIHCTCGSVQENGLMLQCDICYCWQHFVCLGLETEDKIPEKYICFYCLNPPNCNESRLRDYLHSQWTCDEGHLARLLPGTGSSDDVIDAALNYEAIYSRCVSLERRTLQMECAIRGSRIRLIASDKYQNNDDNKCNPILSPFTMPASSDKTLSFIDYEAQQSILPKDGVNKIEKSDKFIKNLENTPEIIPYNIDKSNTDNYDFKCDNNLPVNDKTLNGVYSDLTSTESLVINTETNIEMIENNDENTNQVEKTPFRMDVSKNSVHDTVEDMFSNEKIANEKFPDTITLKPEYDEQNLSANILFPDAIKNELAIPREPIILNTDLTGINHLSNPLNQIACEQCLFESNLDQIEEQLAELENNPYFMFDNPNDNASLVNNANQHSNTYSFPHLEHYSNPYILNTYNPIMGVNTKPIHFRDLYSTRLNLRTILKQLQTIQDGVGK
ncbi:uncharacterized protein LOC135926010 isoform X2 [Gordionus sp. m RMFG-2023]|uniref:uncharacterized protein LOC135926010 isoform X2 n=1 Tax=Gordionus sp. m RMFG-2023 TaxID=3053472 RepID=UPI0031FC9ACF